MIPKLLHLIWVGPNDRPLTMTSYINSWQALMPTWTVRLWTNADVTETEFPEAFSVLCKANTGVQKADIMRYFIIRKYGGFYIDADVEPHKSLEPLVMHDIVVCHDLEITWPYVASAFFGAVPDHPVLSKCCDLVARATLNTNEPHMHTGPRLFGEAVISYDAFVLPIQSFYRNKTGQTWIDGLPVTCDFDDRFGSHLYAKQWN